MPNPPAAFSPLAMVRWIFSDGDDVAQMPGDNAAARRGENIADEEEIGQCRANELSKERTTTPS